MGGQRQIVGGDKFDAKKKSNKKYTVTLGGHRSMNLHTTTNQKQAPIMEESKDRRGDRRGSTGGCKSIVLGAIAVRQTNETKQKTLIIVIFFFSARS